MTVKREVQVSASAKCFFLLLYHLHQPDLADGWRREQQRICLGSLVGSCLAVTSYQNIGFLLERGWKEAKERNTAQLYGKAEGKLLREQHY